MSITKPAINKVSTPHLYRNAVLVLAAENGEILGRVRLEAFSVNHLVLMRMPREMYVPKVAVGQPLKIYGKNRENTAEFTLQGVVKDTTRLYIEISDLRLNENPDKRMYPRYILSREATLFNRDNPRLSHVPQACELQDISLNGAKIVSNYEYHVGLNVMLQADLYNKSNIMHFDAQIVRMQEISAQQLEYGLLFAELSQARKADLQRQLQVLKQH